MNATNNKLVPLYFWAEKKNFGDQLSKDIVEFFLETNTYHVSSNFSGKLLAIGSILDKCMPGDVIWGTGVHPKMYVEGGGKAGLLIKVIKSLRTIHYDSIEVLGVRGPITHQYLLKNGGKAPEIFGDPAILAPYLYPKDRNPVQKFLFINHFSVSNDDYINFNYVNAGEDWRYIVDRICDSEYVISSSLHGLILAESYGVPAIFLRNSNEGLIKYLDYYGATGRFPIIANSVEEAIALKGLSEPPSFHSMGVELIDVLKNWKSRSNM